MGFQDIRKALIHKTALTILDVERFRKASEPAGLHEVIHSKMNLEIQLEAGLGEAKANEIIELARMKIEINKDILMKEIQVNENSGIEMKVARDQAHDGTYEKRTADMD